MSLYFLDNSALVKRYVTETGSNWVRALTDPAMRNPLIIARITWVEVLSALTRREREGSISSDIVARAIRTFGYDLDMQYQITETTAALTRGCRRIGFAVSIACLRLCLTSAWS